MNLAKFRSNNSTDCNLFPPVSKENFQTIWALLRTCHTLPEGLPFLTFGDNACLPLFPESIFVLKDDILGLLLWLVVFEEASPGRGVI
jgi:hypothetical protein